jgi:hypothetical protein
MKFQKASSRTIQYVWYCYLVQEIKSFYGYVQYDRDDALTRKLEMNL